MPRLSNDLPHAGAVPAVAALAPPLAGRPSANPDATLIAACEHFLADEQEYDRLTPLADVLEGDETDESRAAAAAMEEVSERQKPDIETICTVPARTAAGWRAKAATVLRMPDIEGYPLERAARQILRAVAGKLKAEQGASVMTALLVPPLRGNADAELLAACARFREAHDHYHHPTDPRWEEFTHQWHDTLDVILDTPATTHEGIRARAEVARAALLVQLTEQDAEGGTLASAPPEGRLALSVLDDLVGGARLSGWTAKQMPTGCWATPAAGQGDAS